METNPNVSIWLDHLLCEQAASCTDITFACECFCRTTVQSHLELPVIQRVLRNFTINLIFNLG